MTRNRLDDLVLDVPGHVTVDPARAWRSGRRRRLRARSGLAVAAVAVVALLGALLGLVPSRGTVAPADGGERAGVTGYPQRVDTAWLLRDLPETPGPLAGLLQSEDRWLPLSPSGRLWRLGDVEPGLSSAVTPTLSADGTRLAYVAGRGDDARMVVRDLLDGSVTHYDVAGPATQGTSLPMVAIDRPGFFSADGSRVLVAVDGPSATEGYAVLGPGDQVSEVDLPPGGGQVAGWVGEDVAVLVPGRSGATLVVTTRAGLVIREVPLGPGSSEASRDRGWTSPDGDRIAIGSATEKDGTAVFLYDTTTGARLDAPSSGGAVGADAAPARCAVAWRGDTPLLPTTTYPGLITATLRPPTAVLTEPSGDYVGTPLVSADPRIATTCSVWAADALAGEQHRGINGTLFGSSDLRLWWWWREGVVLLSALAVALVLVVRRRRGRRRLSVGSARHAP